MFNAESWKVIIMSIITELTSFFGTWITEWLTNLFNKWMPQAEPETDNPLRVGAAPAEVRSNLRKRIMDFVTAVLGKFPLIGKFAIARISSRIDAIIDSIYDKLFPAEIANGSMPTLADFQQPMTLASAGVPEYQLTDTDVAACKTEAGVSS